MSLDRLTSVDFDGPTTEVARSLLGKTIVRRCDDQLLRCIIVEVEAYLPERDSASHSYRGQKNSNRSMFLPRGHLYVYPIHSRHCMNIVTEEEGRGAAVLIRAAEPIAGAATMWHNRFPISFSSASPTEFSLRQLRSLCQGPGRLCESMRVDRALDGVNLSLDSTIWMEPNDALVTERGWTCRKSGRIGISSAKSRQLRYFIDGHAFVSGLARDHSAGRTWRFATS